MKTCYKAIENKSSNFGKKKTFQRAVEFDYEIIEILQTKKSHRFIDGKKKLAIVPTFL